MASFMIKAESVLNAAPDAMVIVDEKGTILLANLQTEKLFACDHEELMLSSSRIARTSSFATSGCPWKMVTRSSDRYAVAVLPMVVGFQPWR